MNRIVHLLTALLLAQLPVSAQSYGKPDHDTTYYHSYKGTIIGRVYLSRNYMQVKLNPPGSLPTMKYHANTPLSIGLGFTYKFVSFSLSKGLNFLESNATKGATRSTDLQLHLYKRKWTLDAIGQFYRGYYLSPHGLASPDGHTYYIRPDVGVQLVGVGGYRVMNDQRFTYGAGLSQNAWQEKSAGSILLGGQAFYLALNGDSALVPRKVDSVYNERDIRKLHLLEIGPGTDMRIRLLYKGIISCLVRSTPISTFISPRNWAVASGATRSALPRIICCVSAEGIRRTDGGLT